MNAAFLICALALHPISFHNPAAEELQKLRDFIKSHYPNAEMVITPTTQRPSAPDWERVPLRWNNMSIWVRRKPVVDRPKRSA